MIGRLCGYAIGVESYKFVLMCSDVGYEVSGSTTGLSEGDILQIWTHEHAPQDAPHELYGFRERADRDLFRRLLNVQGVGPKVAMRIVTNKGVTADGVAVPATLRAIRGVGPKIVQNIVEAFT